LAENNNITNWERDIAKDFALHTRRHIFLTGKAGTGKTTLLLELLKETDKKYIVAAPTGVAAINAGGITLHSLFLFPFKTFIPYRDRGHDLDLFYDGKEMGKHQKFNRAKLDLLLELELLVIDEISMVRADIFDAIDQTLRRVRRNGLPFGGVQLLVIGDLYQLSPVVKNNVQDVLSLYYKSPYFFDSLVWQEANAVIVELKKVYRQEDQSFIDILNSVRDGHRDEKIIAQLNENFNANPDYSNTITLTTHNRKAQKINEDQLAKLPSKLTKLTAEVTGMFPENAYPNNESLELKVGAQVMFVRNHQEGLYYNGKIGKVTEIGATTIKVKDDKEHSVIVEKVEWKKLKYEVEKSEGKIVQKEVGSFTQYPLRLAWAVTVHKSQGLTFDKVILDLEGTFASGQLYVALSRCRSLEGLTLSSKIITSNVITDSRVQTFTQENQLSESISEVLSQEKESYEDYKLKTSFDFQNISIIIDLLEEYIKDEDIPSQANALMFVKDIKVDVAKIDLVGKNFQSKLDSYFVNKELEKGFVQERTNKAITYFTDQLHSLLVVPIIKHAAEYTVKKNSRKYIRILDSIEQTIWRTIENLYKLNYRNQKVYLSTPAHDRGEIKQNEIKKRPKGETINITFNMYKEGKAIAIIAKERGLTTGTIESHIAKLIEYKKISIFDVMKEYKVESALPIVQANNELNLTELIKKIPFKVSYGELRWLTSYNKVLEG